MQLADRNIKSQQFSNPIIKHPSPSLRCNMVNTYKALILQDKKVLKSAKGNVNKRSFRKESHINSNTMKSFTKLSNQNILSNQRNISKLKKHELSINEPVHSTLDENTNPNVYDDIETHRFSNIYKPSKFINSAEVFPEIPNYLDSKSNNKLHSKHKSNGNIVFSLPLNASLTHKSEIRDHKKINQVNSKLGGEYCASFQDSVDHIHVSQRNYIIDNSKNLDDLKAINWSFQTQCRAGKSQIQVIFNYFINVFYE